MDMAQYSTAGVVYLDEIPPDTRYSNAKRYCMSYMMPGYFIVAVAYVVLIYANNPDLFPGS